MRKTTLIVASMGAGKDMSPRRAIIHRLASYGIGALIGSVARLDIIDTVSHKSLRIIERIPRRPQSYQIVASILESYQQPLKHVVIEYPAPLNTTTCDKAALLITQAQPSPTFARPVVPSLPFRPVPSQYIRRARCQLPK